MDNWVRIANALDGSDRIAELEAEVDWLRAENEALTAMYEKRRDMALSFDAERGRLQALIDAYAVAVAAMDDDDRSPTSVEWACWIGASNALLAAATKEADRD